MSNSLIHQLNNPVQLQKLSKKLSVATSVLLVIAIAWLLAEITWLFFPQDEPVQTFSVSGKPVINNVQQQQTFKKLTAASIFGSSASKTPVAQTRTAPETKLNLTLKGVLAATPMTLASAIIAQGKSGREEIYGIGDKMKGGVTIKEIHPDHVILDRRGQLETLKLQKQSGISSKLISRNRTPLKSGSNAAKTPAEALSHIRSEILKSPTSFGDFALPVMVKENGKQIGYRLQPQSKGKLLAEIGIQHGDVITRINGIKLDKPQNGISALRKLSTANKLDMTIKRNGTEVPLSIQLK